MPSSRFYLTAQTAYGFFWTLMVTLSMVFMVTVAGLDPLQMVLVGTVLELSAFLFEIPTGVLADAVSRRLSVIVGHALIGGGYLIVPLFPTFEMILLAQVFFGLGATFVSGAYSAWLTSEVGTEAAAPLFLRAGQLRLGAGFVGIAVAVALGHVSLALPIAAGAIGIALISVFMLAFMKEDHFDVVAADERDSWKGLAEGFVSGVRIVRVHHALVLMLVVAVVFGAFSEGIDRLFVPLVVERFELPALGPLDGITWWGIIAALANLAGVGALALSRRRVDLVDRGAITRALTLIAAGIAVAVICVGTADALAGVLIAYWLLMGLRAASGPLTLAWLNPLLPRAASRHAAVHVRTGRRGGTGVWWSGSWRDCAPVLDWRRAGGVGRAARADAVHLPAAYASVRWPG